MKINSKETDRIKELSKFAIKFANTVFVLGILFWVLVAVCAEFRIIINPVHTYYYSFLLFAVFAAALISIMPRDTDLWENRFPIDSKQK